MKFRKPKSSKWEYPHRIDFAEDGTPRYIFRDEKMSSYVFAKDVEIVAEVFNRLEGKGE